MSTNFGLVSKTKSGPTSTILFAGSTQVGASHIRSLTGWRNLGGPPAPNGPLKQCTLGLRPRLDRICIISPEELAVHTVKLGEPPPSRRCEDTEDLFRAVHSSRKSRKPSWPGLSGSALWDIPGTTSMTLILQIDADDPGRCAALMEGTLGDLTTALETDNRVLNAAKQQVLGLTKTVRDAWEPRGGTAVAVAKTWASTIMATGPPIRS